MSDKALYVGFNADRSCLTIGTEIGFFVYDTFPFKRKCSHCKYLSSSTIPFDVFVAALSSSFHFIILHPFNI